MSELIGYYSTGLSYSPDDLRYGFDSETDYFQERIRNNILIEGKSKILQIAGDYAKSYVSGGEYTLMHFRDQLLYLALTYSTRVATTRDLNYTKLTVESYRRYQNYGYSFWSEIPKYTQPGFYGLAGSLAFEMYRQQDTGNGLYPLELLKKMLSYYWQRIGIDEITPQAKQDALFRLIEFNKSDIKNIQKIITIINSSSSNSLSPTGYKILKFIRQSLLTQNQWENLPQRMLLGEYSDNLWDAIALLFDLTPEEQASYNWSPDISTLNVQENIFSLLPLGGIAQFYLNLSINSLIDCVDIIHRFSDETRVESYSSFLENSKYDTERYNLGMCLSTAYDAWGVLGMFNTFLEAKGVSYRIFLTILQIIKNCQNPLIPKQNQYRLYEFL